MKTEAEIRHFIRYANFLATSQAEGLAGARSPKDRADVLTSVSMAKGELFALKWVLGEVGDPPGMIEVDRLEENLAKARKPR